MNVVLLKKNNDAVNIKEQQNVIIKYAHKQGIRLDATEIEASKQDSALEERQEFRGFLRSLNHSDMVLIYDFTTLSYDTAELTKILKCFFEREISLHLCKLEIFLSCDSSALDTLSLLSDFRQNSLSTRKQSSLGRPKGRMSQSKFDMHRAQIVELLIQKESVSAIAKILQVSRTSLKDYINSRGLKELATAKILLLNAEIKPQSNLIINNEKCSLIGAQKGTKNGDM